MHADIDVKNAIDLLLDQWTLPRPELLISIISDTKSKELDEKLSKHIANGLSQVNVAHVYFDQIFIKFIDSNFGSRKSNNVL